MPDAVIFIGLQGAGKTTYYEQHFRDTHVLISRDVQKTRDAELALFRKSLAGGQSLVVDNTNATRDSRAPYIASAKASGFRVIAYQFDVPVRTAIGRNNHRKDKKPIPVPAILRTSKQLEPPAQDEGFDQVVVVTTA